MTWTHYIFGHNIETKAISISEASCYFSDDNLHKLLSSFMKVPLDDILAVIEKTGQLLSDQNKTYYQQCLKELPEILNYAPKMVETGLVMVPTLLCRDTMLERISHLGNHHLLDYPIYSGKRRMLRAIPTGIVCHIVAGNTFLSAISSILYGIITRNINILKLSSSDHFFPVVFKEVFKEANTEKILVPYLAQTYWSQSNIEALDVVEQNSNVILLFGSEEAVKSFKKDVAPKCEVLACGPKVSFGIVTADQAEDELATAAKGFAADVVFWEQRACTACQNIFVEKSENSDLFIKMLFSGLEKTVQSTVNDGFTLQLVLDPSCIYNRLKLQVETQKLKDDALLQLLKEIRYEKVPVFKQSKEESMISLFEISFADPVFAASHSEAWESKKDC